MSKAELVETSPGVFHVESIIEDGAIEVGPNALDRAVAFAGGD